MNVKAAIEIVIYGGVIPAVAALIVLTAIGWLWPQETARRYGAGVAFAVSVLVGFVALPATKSLAPTQFWDWLPYLGILAAFVSGLTRAGGVLLGERWLAAFLFALVTGWLTVPHWPELEPPWPVQVALFATVVVVVAWLLELLPASVREGALPLWLMLAASMVCVLIMSEVSVTFGQLAALPAGALAGCAIAALLHKGAVDWRGLSLPYATVVCGYAYVGAVYPTTPLWPLVAAPLAPLALWLVAIGPLARLSGWKAWIAQALCVGIPLVVVAAMLLAGGGASQDW